MNIVNERAEERILEKEREKELCWELLLYIFDMQDKPTEFTKEAIKLISEGTKVFVFIRKSIIQIVQIVPEIQLLIIENSINKDATPRSLKSIIMEYLKKMSKDDSKIALFFPDDKRIKTMKRHF
jgi:hypothetical protein